VAYAEVPPGRMSAATTFYSAMQQISLTVGIPVSAGVLQMARLAHHHAVPMNDDFALAFLVVAGISALAGPTSLLLPKRSGQEMSGSLR
jgi:hypothetical protein